MVTDPEYDAPGPIADVGAVYLYDGQSLQVISVLTGSREYDRVGLGGVVILTNGNFVVGSPFWNPGGTGFDAGAVTWGSAVTGVAGAVSIANSLIGDADDRVGFTEEFGKPATPLTNGNYVVVSRYWKGGRGAVTLANGASGLRGKVTEQNSLTGNAGDAAGSGGVVALPNGNYLVMTDDWSMVRGAVTWGNGTTGVKGLISATNSLVGGSSFDRIGGQGITILSNGNYLVNSGSYHDRRGAVTWGNSMVGVKGVVSSANSLVGGNADDRVGGYGYTDGIKKLPSGNYVVRSIDWNGRRGAATWGSGTAGVKGVVSASNSMVGSKASDMVGSGDVIELTNGSIVVSSPVWNSRAGAVTWGGPSKSGVISSANSLVGGKSGDLAGNGGVVALLNGNYVVSSPSWGPAQSNRWGAVTWCHGAEGRIGLITNENSLTGRGSLEQVGYGGVAALRDGNYAISSPDWELGKGAVTWGNGTTGMTGLVSGENSLVGTKYSDGLGNGNTFGSVDAPPGLCRAIMPLDGGGYLVSSPEWDGLRGAVTRIGDGASRIGTVTSANSLTGSAEGDQVGSGLLISGRILVPGLSRVGNGNFLVSSPNWGRSRGAVTWMNGVTGLTGTVSELNSIIGGVEGDRVGGSAVTMLANGNYVLPAVIRNVAGNLLMGAAVWGSATEGSVGIVSAENALLGEPSFSPFANGGIVGLSDGHYLAITSAGGGMGDEITAGFVTAGDGHAGSRGTLTLTNSTPVPEPDPIAKSMHHAYDPVHRRAIVSHVPGTVVFLLNLGPEMTVAGNGKTISHGDASPDAGDHTDFGFAAKGGMDIGERSFRIKNSGVIPLELSPNPSVSLTGSHADDFSIIAPPSSRIDGGGESEIRLEFRPRGLGLRTARLTVFSQTVSGGTAEYSFVIQGTGLSILEHWRLKSFGEGASTTGNMDDFDGDGVVNWLEFAFGTNPAGKESGPFPLQYVRGASGGGVLLLPGQPGLLRETGSNRALFTRRADYLAAGLVYTPEFSYDLVNWEMDQSPLSVMAVSGDVEAVGLPLEAAGPAAFFRIRVGLTAVP